MNNKLLNKIIWQINRSPLRLVIKSLLRLFYINNIRQRIELARTTIHNTNISGCAKQLNKDGYTIITNFIAPKLIAEINESAQKKITVLERAASNQTLRHKSFWTRLLDEDMQDGKIPISSPYVRFATQPAVVQILAESLGEVPRLDYVLLTLSHYSEKELSYSQLWHRDHDDVRVIKLFVYLSDVIDDKDGPFTFIPAPISDKYGYSLKSHRTDNEIFDCGLANISDVKKMIEPKLSVFMVETSRCLHMGSRLAPEHTRLLYTATYTTIPCMFPQRKNNFIKDIEINSSVEKMLLDL